MLTNIEWWGGLLLIWTALVFWSHVKLQPWKSRFFRLANALGFLGAAFVISLYFYDLGSSALQITYWVAIGLALAGVLLLVLPLQEDPGSKDDAEQEENGWLVNVIGTLLIVGPHVTACILGGMKSYGMLQAMGVIA